MIHAVEPVEEDEAFGTRLRRYRKASGLTQRQLAEAGGVDYTYICRMENGQPPPSTETLGRIAAALGLWLPHLEMLTRRIPHPLREKVKHGSLHFRLLIALLALQDVTPEQVDEMLKILLTVRLKRRPCTAMQSTD